MRLRSAFFFCALTLGFFMSDAEAQGPDRIALANRLLDAMGVDDLRSRADSVFAFGQTPQARESAKAEAAFRAKYLPPDVVRPPLAQAYADLFPRRNSPSSWRFYESPIGKKLTTLQPQLANALQGVISRAYRDHFEEYSRDVLKIPAELLKRP